MLRKRRITVILTLTALIALAVGIVPVSAQNGDKAKSLLVNLEVLSPAVEGNHVPLEVSSGWPLTLRLSANNPLGIGEPGTSLFQFPFWGSSGYLVFADPLDCWGSYFRVDQVGELTQCLADGSEIYLKFTASEGFPSPLNYDNNPKISVRFFSDDIIESPLGPPTGPAGSGYGFGPSGLLPELVLLADTGPGVVVQEDTNSLLFILPTPREARNLAGFLGSLSYELIDATGRTSIEAHLTVPPGLFDPLTMVDRNIGGGYHPDPNTCGLNTDTALYQVDGGPLQTWNNGSLNEAFPVLQGQITTIRAFVVNHKSDGKYLSTLKDMNGDGIVDAKDAVLDGYQLLSTEVKIRFQTRYQADQLFGFPFDFDGNGCVGGIVAPAGAGGLTRVVR